MPTFRNRNSGQVVTHDAEALVELFRRWARWEEIDGAPTPAAAAPAEPEEVDLPSTNESKATWVAFAENNGVDITSDMTKDEVVDAVRAAFPS